ncbi:TraR/DksA family transcriptional regulator [Streptomyces sp. NBC_01476]|uniref:TraR/DksA family transcriptional regulator n=1 Tax=Streptomyces sp. NBC_01476 TaxID=2903881 RepID=UPI002E30DF5F|nr:TraR/DksA family transcriptional regulator [Streptomyces sp. NBC_01476]
MAAEKTVRGATKKKAPAAKAARKKPAANAAGGKPAGRTAGSGTEAEAAGAGPAADGSTTSPAGTGAGRRSPARKDTAKKAVKKAPAKKAPARTAAAGKAAAAKKTGARKVAAKKTVADSAATSGSPVPAARIAAQPGTLAVLPGEDPWTPEEVEEARSDLLAEVERLKSELVASEAAVAGLMRDSGDSTGDEADTGSKNITREYELALAANTRETLSQADHALQRLDEGTYGLCEVCGNPIGKARMQAFPRAVLCLDDKQRQERR